MKYIGLLVTLFVSVFIYNYWLLDDYFETSKQNYTHTVKNEIRILIDSKLDMTYELAQNYAISQKIIEIMKTKEYDKLYRQPFFRVEYKDFSNISIHIVDNEGRQRYLSWTKKSLDEYILNARKDLKKLYKDPRALKSISIGKFDISFKGIVPIYDEEGRFLGVVEVITHFNSISSYLQNDEIYSAVVADKRYKKQLQYANSRVFIDDYYVSNIDLNDEVRSLIEEYGIERLIHIPAYRFVPDGKGFLSGYYVVSVPIKDIDKETIGYYLAFIKDKHFLERHEMLLHITAAVMSVLFLIVAFMVYLKNRQNERLIRFLNKEVEEQIEKNLQLIYRDPLTGSYKKLKFDKDKSRFIGAYVVMFNIRNFSKINEEYSFAVGDEVLKIVAKRVESILGQKIYRIDSDEFVFFSEDVDKEIALIKKSFIYTPVSIASHNLKMRLSFSFSVIKNDGKDILRRLSIALKKAKQEPFKEYIIYEPVKTDQRFSKFNALLYDAIFLHEKARIVPYFQPIIENGTGKIVKYEALARLETKEETYTPFYFLEVARSSGFLYEITKIIIDKSLEKISMLHEKVPVSINLSINITEDDLLTLNLKHYLNEMLQKYEMSPEQITFEILEGITSTGTKNSIAQLKELKEMGIKLAIDDFGVEYSNFERISELDIDFLKIDGKYIKEVATNEKSYQIVKAITDFAHSMDIEVVAEFVESKAIYEVVCDLGIDYSQGYYFYEPAAEITPA